MSSLHVMLDALTTAYHNKEGVSQEDIGYAYENEPESVVFYPGDDEPGDYDDMQAIKDVGERDIRAKIAYWSDLIDN